MSSVRDFKHALRALRRSPPLVVVAILSLALGIGANVTVFSVVREMILDDLSARRPDRLARVEGVDVSYALYRDLRAAGAFADLAFHRGLRDRIWRADQTREIAWTVTTSANFFDVLGVTAARGMLYTTSDQGRELAVISYGFWQRRLSGDTAVPGRTIQLDGRLYTIAGVLPPDYRSVYGHGVSPEVYLSDAGNAGSLGRFSRLFGRLHDRISRQQTRQAFAAALARLEGKTGPARMIEVQPMSGFAAHVTGSGDGRGFFLFFVMLLAVAGMLMLIGCANVAGLLVARALNRRRELGIRRALGANRWQLLRPLLAEGIVLAAAGAAAGLALDGLLRDRLRQVQWPSAYGIPIEFHFHTDAGLMAYGALTAFAALLLSSLIPALRGAQADLSLALKQREPAFSVRRLDVRNGFVALQVVLSIVLLAMGGLFSRSLFYLVETGPGFDVAHTLVAAAHGNGSWDFRQQAKRRIESVPGVLAVTSAGTLPLMGELPDAQLRRQGEPLSAMRHVYTVGAGENYCRTLGIRILRGREFESGDRGRTPIPVVVNRTLARQFFADREPVGEYLRSDGEQRFQIVGVAADSRMRTMGEAGAPMMFTPEFNAQFLIRAAGDPAQWMEPLRRALGDIDPAAALDIRPLAEAAAGALFPMRVAAGFLGAFSLLGMSLALVGLHGSLSYAVGRRTHELGIRAALGASRARIMWTAVRDGIAVLGCGTIVGVPLALASIRPLVALIPDGVNPWAPLPLIGIVALLLATGALASWIPARRAAAVQPSMALRED
jgi:predicted permease